MHNEKLCKENTFSRTALFSVIHKKIKPFILYPNLKMYAPDSLCAYILCSIIIETRPEEGIPQRNQSFFVYCVEIEFRHRSPDRPVTKTNLFFMFIAFVCFSPLGHGIRCRNLSGNLLTRRFWQLSTVRAQLKSTQKGLYRFIFVII